MTDIFFSYSSKDRERVRPVRDALAEQGFDVFWDQTVPAGTDWDRWIRQHLNDAKCAIVFWSVSSVASDNVRHEAAVAKQQGKFVPVLLDTLTAEQFPMGLYATQAVNLAAWTGSTADGEWEKLLRETEARLTPLWVRRMIDGLEAELVSERARRESAERRDRTLREQIIKEANARQDLVRELEHAREEIEMLKEQARSMAAHRAAKVEQSPPPPRQAPPAPISTAPQEEQEKAQRPPAPVLVEAASPPPPATPEEVWEPRVKIMLGIAGGLMLLMLALIPLGLSAAGFFVMLIPTGGLVAMAISIKNKNERRLNTAGN
jgi:hypothetical protein